MFVKHLPMIDIPTESAINLWLEMVASLDFQSGWKKNGRGHQMNIPEKFGFNCPSGFSKEVF